jgi:cellulose 1,4-beta-cellobiosidase
VPSAPVGLTATAASSTVINLSWTAVTPPANCTISSYTVYRSTTSGFSPSSSNQVGSVTSGTTFSNTGLTASTTYYYKIEAVDADGSSAASSQASATTSAAGGGFACHIAYSITNQWPGGFGAAITINNTGTTAISSWTLTWTFANGQTITQLWNGTETQSGANVTVNNLSYNGTIAAGGNYSGMGFNGSWNNTTNAVPTSFAVNGTTCN